MRRLSCSICHTTNARYSAGKRVRCPGCQLLVGSLCCTTIVGHMPVVVQSGPDAGKTVQHPIHGATCVRCVPSVAKVA